MLKKWQTLIFVAILVVAFFLRFHHYEHFPIVGETADEFAWTLLGSSLIQEGQPISWSRFKAYEKGYWISEKETFDIGTGQMYPLVNPVLDQPPLFSLLPGLAQTVRGAEWSAPASAKVMRLPLLFLGVLNVALLYFVSKKLFENKAFFYIPVLIYATAPLFVFSSRLVVSENLLTTWILITMWLLLSTISPKKLLLALGIVSAAAVLTKMAGVVVPVAIIIYGITQKSPVWKAGLIGMVAGFIAFMAYGAYYNWALFLEVFSTQASRGFGFLTLHNRLFLHPSLVMRLFVDGWLMSGLIAMALLTFEEKKKFVLVSLFFVLNLLFILFFVDETTHYAWYDFPTFPLLALALGYAVMKILTEKKYLIFGLFWLLLLPTFRYALLTTGLYYSSLEVSTWIGRAFVGLGMVPWLVQQVRPAKPWARQLLIALMVFIVLANIVAVIRFNQAEYWAADTLLHLRGFIFPD